MSSLSDDAAAAILETVPLVMREIRRQMRSQMGPEISVPLFRIMGYLSRHPGASLTDVADHMGLTPPSVSKMVDGLVERGLVLRVAATEDRRRIELALTPAGSDLLGAAYTHTKKQISKMLEALESEELLQLIECLNKLHSIVTTETSTTGKRK